jgi:hypothetical protein
MTKKQVTEFEALIRAHLEWEAETFPEQTRRGRLAHLREEVMELDGSIYSEEFMSLKSAGIWTKSDEDLLVEEAVDCMLLLIGIVGDPDKLFEGMRAKYEKNRGRKWGEQNELGYWEHVEEEG